MLSGTPVVPCSLGPHGTEAPYVLVFRAFRHSSCAVFSGALCSLGPRACFQWSFAFRGPTLQRPHTFWFSVFSATLAVLYRAPCFLGPYAFRALYYQGPYTLRGPMLSGTPVVPCYQGPHATEAPYVLVFRASGALCSLGPRAFSDSLLLPTFHGPQAFRYTKLFRPRR